MASRDMSDFTNQELAQFFDSLPEDKRDGMTKAQFMAEVRKILDPKHNKAILKEMIAIRRKDRTYRHNKRVADRALERSRLGLR